MPPVLFITMKYQTPYLVRLFFPEGLNLPLTTLMLSISIISQVFPCVMVLG